MDMAVLQSTQYQTTNNVFILPGPPIGVQSSKSCPFRSVWDLQSLFGHLRGVFIIIDISPSVFWDMRFDTPVYHWRKDTNRIFWGSSSVAERRRNK